MDVLRKIVPDVFCDVKDVRLQGSIELCIVTQIIAGHVSTVDDIGLAKSFFLREISDQEYCDNLSDGSQYSDRPSDLRLVIEKLLSADELKEILAQNSVLTGD